MCRMLAQLLTALTIAVVAHAQDNPTGDTSDRNAYLNSVVLQAQIDVCVIRAPQLAKELTQALEKWRQQKGEALARGEAIVRKEWSLQSPSFEDRLQHLKGKSADLFELASNKEIVAKCESLLA